jgi:nucleoside-diphosphate-sugar epimerase
LAKILLVGATGFIGSQLAEFIVGKGHELVISVRSSSKLDKLKHLTFKTVELNFNDIDAMASIINTVHPDYVINNAGVTKSKTQEGYDVVNVNYAVNLAKACMKANIDLKKYVFMSSIAAHGPADFQNEDILRIDQKPHPVTMYGVSKLRGEKELREIEGLPYLFLRPTIVYGPNEKDLYTVFKFVNNRLGMYSGDGNQKFSFIYIDDLLEVVLAACTCTSKNKSYFVTDGNYYSPKELNTWISQELNRKILHFGLSLSALKMIAHISEFFGKFSNDVPALNLDKLNEIKAKNWHCDINPLIQDLGVKPKILLREGLSKTVKWYKTNNWL